ncbi:MAG: ankyrin repeat domain-containing protein [Verrucomicrobiota bacterium]
MKLITDIFDWDTLYRCAKLMKDNPNHPLLDSPAFVKIREGVNLKDDLGNTPLMPASAKLPLEVVSALLRLGANVNAKNEDGLSALMFAAHKKRVEIVELLLAYDADVRAMSHEGGNAMCYAGLSVTFTKVFAANKIMKMLLAASQ